MKQKQLVILGATGSIGDSTLKVVKGNPDKLNVIGIAGKKNYKKPLLFPLFRLCRPLNAIKYRQST